MSHQEESRTSTGPTGKRIHRRTKQQIPNLFVCGDPNCRKSYGTNAALYTHIKKKHEGVEPVGTHRPNLNSSTKGRKSRTLDDHFRKDESVVCKLCSRKECKCKADFDLDSVGALAEEDFIMFVRYISLFGQDGSREGGIWVRVVDDVMEEMSAEKVMGLLEQWSQEFGVPLELTPKQVDYLSLSSKFWDRGNIRQLYCGLFCALKFLGRKSLQKALAKSQRLKWFLSCLQSHQKELQIVRYLFCKTD